MLTFFLRLNCCIYRSWYYPTANLRTWGVGVWW